MDRIFAFGTNSGIQRFTPPGPGCRVPGDRQPERIRHPLREGGEVRVEGELFYRDGEFVV